MRDHCRGLVFTYLGELIAESRQELESQKPDVGRVAYRFQQDPVCRAIRSGELVSPVGLNSRRAVELREEVRKFRATSQRFPEFAGLVAGLEEFVEAAPDRSLRWSDQTGYLLAAVMDEVHGRPSLIYLKSRPTAGDSPNVNLEGLSRDPQVVQYFDSLAVVLIRAFFLVRDYPGDPFAELKRRAYGLLFDCPAAVDETAGAALLGLFAIDFLRVRLERDRFANTVSPPVGTLLTGRIDDQGQVLPVARVEERVACAVDEFGEGLRVIAPRDAPLSPDLENRIGRGKLYYVASVEQLLAALLFADCGERGLHTARAAVFMGLGVEQRSQLAARRLPQAPVHSAGDGRGPQEPVAHEGGVHALSQVWNDRLDLIVATDPQSIATAEGGLDGRRMVQIVLDGGVPRFWTPDPQSGVSPFAAAVYQILDRIDFESVDVVVGFLGLDQFESVSPMESATGLETRLQAIRERRRLVRRGPFMRPVREASLRAYSDRFKSVFVLSDSLIPDLDDFDDSRVESRHVLGLAFQPQGDSPTLFCEDNRLNLGLLDELFRRPVLAILELELDLGGEPAIAWEPEEAQALWTVGLFRLHRIDPQAACYQFRLRFADAPPPTIRVHGTMRRGTVQKPFAFTSFPVVGPLAAMTNPRGTLSEGDFKLWNRICDPAAPCDCGQTGVHLVHESFMSLDKTPVFESLNGCRRGWIMLRDSAPEWVFFRTGCRIDKGYVVALSGRLHFRPGGDPTATGPVPLAVVAGLYTLESGGDTYYLSELD